MHVEACRAEVKEEINPLSTYPRETFALLLSIDRFIIGLDPSVCSCKGALSSPSSIVRSSAIPCHSDQVGTIIDLMPQISHRSQSEGSRCGEGKTNRCGEGKTNRCGCLGDLVFLPDTHPTNLVQINMHRIVAFHRAAGALRCCCFKASHSRSMRCSMACSIKYAFRMERDERK
jgi:hypothetical protein